MRKLSMKNKRKRSENNTSDGESEENGGSVSNAGNAADTTDADTMPKSKRRASRGKNSEKVHDDRIETSQNDESDANEEKKENAENENGHAEKGGAKKRRKKGEQKATTSHTKEENDDEDEEYEVEKIVAHRTVRGRRQFLVRWKGYNEDSDTWEQEKDLNCTDLIEKFLAEQEENDNGEPVTKSSKSPSKKTEKLEKRGKKAKTRNNNAKKEVNDEVSGDDSTEYEVERIIDVYFKKNGKREFLVRWKGFKPADDTWEPEDNLNCPDLIKRFMAKVEEAKSYDPRVLRTNPVPTKRYTLATKDTGRRLSRRNIDKQRATYHQCDE